MGVLYGEGLAIHAGPESCAAAGNCVREALTGVRAGRVSSRESQFTSGCRRRRGVRKATSGVSISREALEPCAVVDPVHARKHLVGNLGDPEVARGEWRRGP